MSLARQFSFMLLLVLQLTAGPVEDLKTNFQTRRDFAEVDRDQQLKKLDDSYLAALQRQIEKTKATGKLDAVIPLMDEVQAVKAIQAGKPAEEALPELPKGASSELKQMRTKHADARAKILKSHAETIAALAEKMEAALKVQETELTKAGKIEEAVAVKRMRESLATNADIQRARDSLDAASATANPGSWRSLLNEEMEVVKKGIWDVGVLSRIPPETKTLAPFVDRLKTVREKPEQILMCHAPGIVEFKNEKPATQARGKIFLATPSGSVRFTIHAGKKLVYEKTVEGESPPLPFEIHFEPTRTLTLGVDPLGDQSHDWSAWLAPEIR